MKMQVKRGAKSNLPALSPGEFAFTTDSEEVFIGGSSENKQIPVLKDGKIPEGMLPAPLVKIVSDDGTQTFILGVDDVGLYLLEVQNG